MDNFNFNFLFILYEECAQNSFKKRERPVNGQCLGIRTFIVVTLIKVFHFAINSRERSTTILTFGKTEIRITLPEGRLDLTSKRQRCRPTGTLPFPRSVSVWRSVIRSGSLRLTSPPTLFSLWSLTESTASPLRVVTRGRLSLAQRLLYNPTVTRKDSMLLGPLVAPRKQGSVLLATTKTTALTVIPESGLALEEHQMTLTRVETEHIQKVIMEKNTSSLWVTYWFSE